MSATPIAELFADDGVFPNNRLPVLIYRQAVASDRVSAEAMEALFEGNGWPPQWRSGIYPFHHYHSTTHEVLGIASGSAHLMLGGPEGREFEVSARDVIVIPAGVGHRRLASSVDFLVVGGYPAGSAPWDLLRGDPGERPAADAAIARVARPRRDPVTGETGGLLVAWA